MSYRNTLRQMDSLSSGVTVDTAFTGETLLLSSGTAVEMAFTGVIYLLSRVAVET